MAPTRWSYPAFLALEGRRCVVIGGGAVAEQKVLGLLEAKASATVVSPEASPGLRALAHEGRITLRTRPYRAGDLAGAFLAFAATDDRGVNAAVWEEAERRGIPLNAVDDPPHCSFIAPSIHRQGDVAVAVSTGGASPALAVRLRERIARLVGPEYADLARLLAVLRPAVAAAVPDVRARTALWYQIVDSDALDLLRAGDTAGAQQTIGALIRAAAGRPPVSGPSRAAASAAGHAESPEPGTVYLVGAGPGDPGLITVRGLDLLRRADVVVYDRLVHPALVAAAPPWGERVFVGKQAGEGHSARQEEINAVLVRAARAGRTVVRLKGGDPFVFGRGAEECEALRAAGVPFEVVAGVTAAVAAPGAAGIPVTHRRHGSAFAVVAGHECAGRSDLDWGALARIPTLVVLMAARTLPDIVARLLEHGRAPDTPAAVVCDATLADERVVTGTLATIAPAARAAGVAAPATLVVGDVVRVREALGAPGRMERPAVERTAEALLEV